MNTKEKGSIGEDVACAFLVKKGFSIVDRNYLKKWGEIDIVTKINEDLHFFEVKSTFAFYDPEENVHRLKTRRLRRIIQTYLSERGYGLEYQFQFHVLCVFLNETTRRARIKWIKNVIL
jgi:putative endonuclease